jgi:alanine racemase
MTLASRIIGVQQLQAGDTVGYGSSFTAEGPLRIGVVACGYADGYPRHCDHRHAGAGEWRAHPPGGPGQHGHGHGGPDPVPQAGMGSEVTLWGRAVKRRRAVH